MSFRRYRPYERGEFIIVAADTSSGGGDYSAAQFLSKTNIDVPTVYHSEVTASEMTPRLHTELERIYKETGVKPVVAYETNNGGVFELERLATLNRNGMYTMYLQKSGIGTTDSVENMIKYGFSTNSATRPAILQILKEAIDNQLITIYDKPTINEMFAFIIKPNGKPQAEQGAHDDLVMSLAIAWQMYQTENPPFIKQRKRKETRRAVFHVS
jgi:phage terminase large subunit